jgi:hypothetical protein
VEQLKKKRAQLEREVERLQRELDLVKGRSDGKIQSLEQSLERATLAVGQVQADLDRATELNQKLSQELSLLQDSVIDQQNEIATLKTKQRLMDAELSRKDKDAAQLLTAARRYKARVDYLKSRLRRTRRGHAMKSDEEDANASMSINASVAGDESPYNSVLGGSVVTGTSSVVVQERRDSIQFPGYMTAEEEYFRLVVLAAKLNVSGTSTPSTVDEMPESILMENDSMMAVDADEQNDPEIDPTTMYSKIKANKVPFHKWHEWAQDYLIAHRMPTLMGVVHSNSFFERKQKSQGFARRVVSKALSRLRSIGTRNKRKSIGIAAGGDGVEFAA